jgi:urocanate hydratase
LTFETPSSPVLHIAQVYRAYASLMESAPSQPDPHSPHDLGGQLLYAGELNPAAAHLIRAANIAGAASLACSASPDALRQALHQGAIDFLVNSLDEALRILKNEIRKRQPVAVAVSLAPETITQELLDRGVLPNLLPPESSSTGLAAFIALGATPLPNLSQAPLPHPGPRLRIWPIPVAYTNRPADFEAILLAHLPPDEKAAQRWLHLSSRYLQSASRRYRSLPLDSQATEKLTAKFGPPLQA